MLFRIQHARFTAILLLCHGNNLRSLEERYRFFVFDRQVYFADEFQYNLVGFRWTFWVDNDFACECK